MPVVVRGLRELQAVFKVAGPEAKKELRGELRSVAEPVRVDAEILTVAAIPRIGLAWSRMRVGVTTRSVYVAPRKRGTRVANLRRPNLAGLIAPQMEAALHRNEPRALDDVDRMLGRLVNRWDG